MSTSRGLVVIFSDGRIEQADCLIVEQGPDATTCVEIDGHQYHLYRYNLLGARGTEYGYLAAKTPPTTADRRHAGVMLFGPDAFGVERLERVAANPNTRE